MLVDGCRHPALQLLATFVAFWHKNGIDLFFFFLRKPVSLTLALTDMFAFCGVLVLFLYYFGGCMFCLYGSVVK